TEPGDGAAENTGQNTQRPGSGSGDTGQRRQTSDQRGDRHRTASFAENAGGLPHVLETRCHGADRPGHHSAIAVDISGDLSGQITRLESAFEFSGGIAATATEIAGVDDAPGIDLGMAGEFPTKIATG